MKTETYIRDKVLLPRFESTGLLVVYDGSPCRRFEGAARSLASKKNAEFIDGGKSSLQARKAGFEAIEREFSPGAVIYVPAAKAQDGADRMNDPYAVFAGIGSVFPDSSSDDFQQIALKLAPKSKGAAVSGLFEKNKEAGGPAFKLIDAIIAQEGEKYPVLKGISGKKSESEILRWLLTQAAASDLTDAESDLQDFTESVFGKDLTEAGEGLIPLLWNAALVTELAEAEGDSFPEAYQTVARAVPDASGWVCEVLRDLRSSKARNIFQRYSEEALRAEAELGLLKQLSGVPCFKTELTFRAETLRLMAGAADAVLKGNGEEAQELVNLLSDSRWKEEEAVSVFTDFTESAARLMDVRKTVKNAFPSSCGSLSKLVSAYADKLFELDRQSRLMADCFESVKAKEHDLRTLDPALPEKADEAYAALCRLCREETEVWQKKLIELVQAEGWPAAGEFQNARVFDELVAPVLKNSGRAIAFIIADGLRYEIGRALAERLGIPGADVKRASAMLPSITTVGKASLLPGGSALELRAESENNGIVPVLGGRDVSTVSDREAVLKALYGDRVKQMTTAEFLAKKRQDIFEKADLLLLRYDDLDAQLEAGLEGMYSSVSRCIDHLCRVVDRLKRIERYTDAVIAADHGFVLNLLPGPGDKAEKPAGSWIQTHDRFLLGEGSADDGSAVMEAKHLGIRSSVSLAAFPRALCAYQAGKRYFHGGLSLQEAVVPVIAMKLRTPQEEPNSDAGAIEWKLEPKNKKVTVLSATLTLSAQSDLLADAEEHSVRIEILRKGDRSRESMGSVRNNDTQIISVMPSEAEVFRVRLVDYPEPWTAEVRALDLKTGVVLAAATFDVDVMQ